VLQSFVLRVVPGPLADGVVVGQLHDVASGRTSTFRNADELVDALRAAVELGPYFPETI
jgi:hypothetical protein